jgi:hypothetical protein
MTAPNMEEVTFDEPVMGESETSTEATDEASESTDNVESSSSNDPDELAVLSTYARNAAQQNQLLQQQMHELRQQMSNVSERVTPVTPRAPVITDEEIRETPAAAMEKLFDAKLEQRLNQTMAPLLEAQRAQQREAQFQQSFVPVVSALRPDLAQYATALAPAVRQLLGNADPTPQNIQMATVMAIGQYAIQGSVPGASAQSSQSAPSNVSRQNVPASAPSSSPRPAPSKIKLTETERRAMTRLGYKEGQESEFKTMIEADEVSF